MLEPGSRYRNKLSSPRDKGLFKKSIEVRDELLELQRRELVEFQVYDRREFNAKSEIETLRKTRLIADYKLGGGSVGAFIGIAPSVNGAGMLYENLRGSLGNSTAEGLALVSGAAALISFAYCGGRLGEIIAQRRALTLAANDQNSIGAP